ncbi:MAG: ferredoxin [Candidatus Brocadia fulgida]|jgi:ferredoxin|uniref:Ferredoxin n=1 Tax=Candidatus Brocadia fulgida TaxID=380242 RepID=A0A0M2UWJ4_9BACT|nr:MAG: ferredoxin [Candidatus Brocadia fulgida]MBV6519597.1 Ferredoxin [Candidatus Brocadia fulgida]
MERRSNVAHKITDDCINCGACESECPVNAISESDDKRIISAETCTDCGNCVEVCPVEAILAP